MKIKKAKSAGLILACIAATGLTGCGKTDETSKKHEAITFMAPYLEVDSFIEEVHKTYPEVNLEVITYSGSNTTTYLQNMLEAPFRGRGRECGAPGRLSCRLLI